ncbi:MAG TPA: hypothetical protein VG937_21825 [Polyangiaceae bacterium]|nr:hypothetical protein [Polyangiaceae bacterium]
MMIRSALRAALTALAVLPFAVAPSFAFAKPKPKSEEAAAPAKKKSVALGVIEGKKNPDVRGWVRDVIQGNFELTDAEDFKVKTDDASIAKMAKDLGVEAVVIGKLEKGRLVLSVRDGATGKQLKEIELKAPQGPKLKAAVEKKLPKQLYAAFGLSTPAEEAKKKALAKQEAEEAGAEEEGGAAEESNAAEGGAEEASASEEGGSEAEPDKSEGDKPAEPREATDTPLDLRLGLHFSKRDFTFKDTLSQLLPNASVNIPLRDYHAQLDLSLFLRAEFYPGAMLGGQGMAANIGLAAGFDYGIPSKTVYTPAGGAQLTLKSNAQDWYVGAKVRVPASPTLGFGFFAGYGQQKYILKGDETAPLVPDVAYNSIRVAADVHATLGKLFVEGQLGARLVTSAGELGDKNIWFPHVAGRAVDARLGLGYQVTPLIAVVASGEFVRYGLDFNPLPDNSPKVAGGAVDQYLGGTLGARLTLPGSPAVTAE